MKTETSTWDPSILGMTVEDKSEMDDDEIQARMIEEINRAADILQAVVAAFGDRMRPTDRRTLLNSANEAIRIARLQG